MNFKEIRRENALIALIKERECWREKSEVVSSNLTQGILIFYDENYAK